MTTPAELLPLTEPSPGDLVRWAVEIAGRDLPVRLVAALTGLDPTVVAAEVSLARSDGRRPGPAEPPPPVADDLAGRLVDWNLGQADPGGLDEAERLLEAMTDPDHGLWARLGHVASERREHSRARRAFERAIEVAGASAAPTGERFELVLAAIRAAQRSGASAAAERHIEHGLRLVDALADPDALARVLALRLDPGHNVDDLWLDRFDRAWATLSDRESVLAVELLRAQAYATYFVDAAAAGELAARALAVARRIDRPAALAAAHDAQRVAAARSADLTPLAEAGRHLVEFGRAGDLEAGARGYEALIFTGLLAGDVDAVDRQLSAYQVSAARSRVPRHALTASAATTLLALLRGDLEGAERRAVEAAGRALSIGDSLGIQMSMAQQAMVSIERDEPVPALAMARDQLADNPMLRWWRLGGLLVATTPGNEAEVAEHLEVLLPDEAAIDRWRFVWLGELVVLADGAAMVGDRERAEMLRQALQPFSDRYATLATAIGLGSIWRPMAALAATLGDDGRADREYRLAEKANRRIGAVPWLARGRLGHARLLATTGRTGDAVDAIAAARATAARLGLHRLAREADAVADDLGPLAAVRPPQVDGLTDREVELLRTVAAGASNRAAADALSVSIKTIERHLSNVYTKLGVAGRNEAIARVFGQPDPGLVGG